MADVKQEPEAPKRPSAPGLPSSRLNPLLNPLLSKQLGRWAHIYYTAPVDKREAAVEQLLRELEEESAKIAAAGNPATPANGNLEISAELCESEADLEQLAETSAGSNAASAAGKPWPVGLREPEPSGVDLAFRQTPTGNHLPNHDFPNAEAVSDPSPHSESSNFVSTNIGLRNIQRADSDECEVESIAFSSPADPTYPTYPMTGTGDPAARRPSVVPVADITLAAWQPRPQGLVMRAGLAFAVVAVITVGTVLWVANRSIAHISIVHPAPAATARSSVSSSAGRAATSSLEAAHRAPLPVQPATAEVATTRTNQQTSTPEASPSHGAEGPSSSQADPSPLHAKNAADKNDTDDEETAKADLETGLRYLNGDGVERDSETAVHHLWKAVGKHNGTALVVLAGLYAKGDGVDKNCDQARVLILAAARQKTNHVETALETLHQSGCE